MASICLPGLFCNLNKWYEHSLSMCHLNRNKCKEAIHFLQENPQYIRWDILSENPFAIDLLMKHPEKIHWIPFCKNPSAIDIILQNPDKINWSALSCNPKAIDILKKNKDKIDYYELALNPGATELIIEELESAISGAVPTLYKSIYFCRLCMNESVELIHYIYTHYYEYIDWKELTSNPGAIDILLKNMDKIDYITLSANPHPKAIKLMMDIYPHYIYWHIFSMYVNDYAFIVKSNKVLKGLIWSNPIIFDYKAISKYKMDIIKEELMMKTLHPSRIAKQLDQGLDIDDL